jgi:hypothetical protein
MRASFCADIPTESAGAAGVPCAHAAAEAKSTAAKRIAAEKAAVVVRLVLIQVFLNRE